MLSRRSFVGKLAAGAAAACAVNVGRSEAKSTTADAGSGDGRSGLAAAVAPPGADAVASPPPPWELLHPLALGSAVAQGWHVAGLTGVADGSCVLELRNQRGRTQRVHLCRNDGSPQGLVYTRRVDLVVMNGGQGDLPTEEGFARAVAEVAHVLAANEGQQESIVSTLLPQAERVQLFAAAAVLR